MSYDTWKTATPPEYEMSPEQEQAIENALLEERFGELATMLSAAWQVTASRCCPEHRDRELLAAAIVSRVLEFCGEDHTGGAIHLPGNWRETLDSYRPRRRRVTGVAFEPDTPF